MMYFWFKALHLIGIVVWFAGLFYLVRLFVYHTEASQQSEPAQTILRTQYEIMEKRLYKIITIPGMVMTVTTAIGLISTKPEILKLRWLHIKLVFVALLLAYHFFCGWIMKQLEKKECQWTNQQFRAFNEAPTVLLFIIILLAVFKNNLPFYSTIILIFLVVITITIFIKIYERKRSFIQVKINEYRKE
ncbi:protoporphyrinogen oxidase HemJ [Cyanobacterium sp. uoEpiScrs1]|uniref:protoporphyrinogen oxidase HemJ n=1 Tax=Cyanobacterium sp. uoEpiScrs1 TaxID=2976343 RepID=UPI002269BBCA|nr:protoporphyrinogen oxidase HemJ [Cyanobacterium sp. uoEpiScrs1]